MTTNTTAIARRDERGASYVALRDFLTAKKSTFAAIAAKHLDPEELLRLALAAASRNPKILEASPESVLAALMDCARIGLKPIGRGGVWLVPFDNRKTGRTEITPITDYRGLLTLARRSQLIRDLEVGVAYERERFVVIQGDNAGIVHEPLMAGDPGKMIAVYAIAGLTTGGKQRAWMRAWEIDRRRARSRASQAGPWVTDYEAMCKKTVLRDLCNLLPMPDEYLEQVSREQSVELGDDDSPVIDVGEEQPKTINDQLLERLAKSAGHKPTPKQIPVAPPPGVESEAHTAKAAAPDPDPPVSDPPDVVEPGKGAAAQAPEEAEPIEEIRGAWMRVLELFELNTEAASKAWASTLPAIAKIEPQHAAACQSKARTLLRKLELAQRAAGLVEDLRELGAPWKGSPVPAEPWGSKVAFLEGLVRELETKKAGAMR